MSMSSNRHALVGEIGAKHLRFAIADIDELTTDHLVSLKTADFSSVQQALFAYLKSLGTYPKVASLAIGGSIQNDEAHVSNSSWKFSSRQLQEALDLGNVTLIATVDAIARATEILESHDIRKIAGNLPVPGKQRAVVTIGDGVEAAIAVPGEGRWSVLHSNADSMGFAAVHEDDRRLLAQVQQEVGGSTVGQVLCSRGLVALSLVLSREAGTITSYSSVADVLAAASKQQEPSAVAALKRFGGWLSRFSHDFALAAGAEGGLYLAGEMPVQMLDVLDRSVTEAASSQSKGGLGAPVYVVTALNVALRGAAMVIA